MQESWGGITLTAGTVDGSGNPNGNLSQLYPNWFGPGAALPIAPMGGPLRKPHSGNFSQIMIKTDQTNGGVVEVWDLTGLDVPTDVSSGSTITNAQLLVLKAAGKAKLMWTQNFTASPAAPPADLAPQNASFMKGLAARYGNSNATGTCALNLTVEGGYAKQDVCPTGFTG